ncbi:MAG: hypothetical protein NTX15_09160 [Candidatus Kapabacteria bacterium]|nr:hypothetical protein [Candidatus Kapabacteria bacterium]
MTDKLPKVQLPAEYHVKLDFYWQSIAMYAITLISYVMIKAIWDSTLQQGLVNVVLTDPVVVLLGSFVLISTVSLIVNSVSRRSVLISDDAITYISRFHERSFNLSEIEKIVVGRERRTNVRGVLAVVRIYVRGRRRPLRLRPGLYENENQLVSALLSLRHPSLQS